MGKGLNIKFFLMITIHTPNPLTPTCKPRQNFSLQFRCNIKQTSCENKEIYQLLDKQLIKYQISELTSKDLYGRQWGEFSTEILGVG